MCRATTSRPPARRRSAQRRVARDAHERLGERAGVAGGREQRALAVAEEPAEDVEVGHDRGQPGGERLERRRARSPPSSRGGRRRRRRGRAARARRPRPGRARARRRRGRARPRGRRSGRSRRGSRTASRRRPRAAPGGGRAARRGRRRSPRAASASPCAARSRRRSGPRAGRRGPRRRARRARSAVVARRAGSARGRRRCGRARPRRRTRRATRPIHGGETHSTWSGATIERSWHAMSDGERKSSTWWTVRITAGDHALVAQRERGVGRDAVLRVDDVEAAVAEDRPQAVAVGRDHRGDASSKSMSVGRHVGDDGGRDRRRAEERSPGGPEREQLDLVPAGRERLGDRERVHDAAARLHGVGEHRDPQRRGGGHGATARTASRAAAAFDGATITPAASQRRRLAPRVLRVLVGAADARDDDRPLAPPARPRPRARPPGRGARRGRARRRAAGSRARRRPPPPRASRRRTSRSTIGCGRPCVYSSSPRSSTACPAAPSSRPVTLPATGPSAGSSDRHRLVGERAAGEEPEQRAAGGPVAPGVDGGLERRDVGRARAGGGARGGLERVVDLVTARPRRRADERRDHPLARRERVRRAPRRRPATAAWRRAGASRSARPRRAARSPGGT